MIRRLALLLACLAWPAVAGPIDRACAAMAAPGAWDDFEAMLGGAEGCVRLDDAARCDQPRRWREGPTIGARFGDLGPTEKRSAARTAARFAEDFSEATGLDARLDGSSPEIVLLFSVEEAAALGHASGAMHGLNLAAVASGAVPCFVRVASRGTRLMRATALIAVEDAAVRDACVLEELFNATGLGADPRGAASLLDVYPAHGHAGVPAMAPVLKAMLALYYRVPEAALTTPAAVRAAAEGLCAKTE